MATAQQNPADIVLHLDPAVLLADPTSNESRYGIGKLAIVQLADSIVEAGGVERPIEVEELSTEERKANKGKSHRVVAGHIRVAAVEHLNTTTKAGLTVPAIVVQTESELDRLKRQLRENVNRKSLSPMDIATAAKHLLDRGVARADVLKLFAKPGGRKGFSVQPMSNAWLNMHLSFLEFPKDIREKIHDGRIPTSAAYELSKSPRDKWESILAAAEVARLKDIDRAEKDEAKLTAQAEKVEAKVKEVEDIKGQLAEAQAAYDAAQAAIGVKLEASTAAYAELKTARAKAIVEAKKKGLDAAATKAAIEAAEGAAQEHFQAAETDAKGAEKALAEAAKTLEKLQKKTKSASEVAEDHRKRLETARAAKPAKAAVTAKQGDVAKAAKEAGVTNHAKLSGTECKAIVRALAKEEGAYQPIFVALLACFEGESTEKQLRASLKKMAGGK